MNDVVKIRRFKFRVKHGLRDDHLVNIEGENLSAAYESARQQFKGAVITAVPDNYKLPRLPRFD